MEVRTDLRKPSPDFKPIFAPFAKIDEEQRMVFGYATTETRDQQGEIVRTTAIEAALPDYMKFANIREMHQPWAVGTAQEAQVDGTGFWVGAHIVDDDAWKKVKTKTYKGFSIGGRVTSRDSVDRSIITGLELTEVSVVDRPANPDAVFTVVKRVDGVLREQPVQKWDCGVSDHQHRAKVEASECMSKRASDLRKKADVATTAALALQSAASEAESHVAVEKAAPRDDSGSGKFSTHDRLAAQAQKKRGQHDRQAAKARDDEKNHRAAASRSLKAGDATAVALHEHLAGAAASLAEAHGRAAEKYRELAARHESAVNKLNLENSMTTGTGTRSINDATRDAELAIKTLTTALGDGVAKGEIDHASASRESRESALDHLKSATEHEEASTASREAGRKSTTEGKPDESTEHNAEADVHDITAVGHHEVADTLHELHAHHAEAMHKAAGEGFDHAGHAEMAKAVGEDHGAGAQHADTMSKMHRGMADGFAKSADLKKSFDHHNDMAGKYADCAAKRGALAKRMTDLHTASVGANAEKVAKTARDAAAAAKVIPVSGLKSTPEGWVDVSGASFFGKAERTDEVRRDLVAKGFAMPTGAHPIETEADLSASVDAFNKMKGGDDVKAHISKRATELKKEVKFEGAMATIVTPMGATKTPAEKPDPAAGTSEAGRQAAGTEANLAAGTTGVEKGTAGEAQRQAAGNEAGLDAGTHGVEKRSAARVTKGMSVVASLANLVEHLENLARSSEMEQLYEGDKDCPIPAALHALCDQAVSALKAAVEHETAEVSEGTDVEVYVAAAKAVGTAAGVARIAKMIREHAVLAKAVDPKARTAMKKVAEAFEKVSGEITAKAATDATAGKATDEKLAAATAERDEAVAMMKKMTGTMKAVAVDVAKLREDSTKKAAEIATLRAEVKKIGEQPLPSKGRPAASSTALRKVDDGAGEGGDTLSKRVESVPVGKERADALLREAESHQEGIYARK